MGYRTSIDFSDKIAPIFKKYANTYGVRNSCSLGAILIDQLAPQEREKLIGLVADDTPVEDIEEVLRRMDTKKALSLAEAIKKSPRRVYVGKESKKKK